MGHKICIKRSKQNFYDIFNKLKKIHGGVKYKKEKVKEGSEVILDDTAVFDLKITHTDNKPRDRKHLYKEYPLGNNISAYVGFIGPNRVANNVIEFILVNVKLFNHFWCAYSDLSPTPPSLDMASKGRVAYGYDYCDELAWEERAFYADNYVRTFKITKDIKRFESKGDFYPPEVLSKIKTYTKNFIQKTNHIDNILVGERYFSGLGCSFLKDPKKFAKEYNHLPLMRTLAIGGVALIFLIVIFSMFYQCCWCKGNKNCMLILTFIMAGFSLIVFILYLVYMIIARTSYDKIVKYQDKCQNQWESRTYDFQQSSTMELEYTFYLYVLRQLGGICCIIGLANFGTFLLYILACRCWNEKEEKKEDRANEVELGKVPNKDRE